MVAITPEKKLSTPVSKVRQKEEGKKEEAGSKSRPLNFLATLMALRNFSLGANCLFVEVNRTLCRPIIQPNVGSYPKILQNTE